MEIGYLEVAYAEPMQVGECPLWHHGERMLYWVDVDGFTVHRLDPATGEHREWRMESEPSALGIHDGGGLVVATRKAYIHLDTQTGAMTPIASAPYDISKARFNDGRVDPAGRFWTGTLYEPRDRPAAQMFCLERGHPRLAWDGGMTNSNGLAFSPDGRSMYHADTTAHRIDLYDFDVRTGTPSNRRVFHQFDADKSSPHYGGRPDGAAVDSEGAYWCAMFEGGRLLRFAPSGEQLLEVKLPLRCPTMVAFGGDDLRMLYITSASLNRSEDERLRFPLTGCVLSLRVDAPGLTAPAYVP